MKSLAVCRAVKVFCFVSFHVIACKESSNSVGGGGPEPPILPRYFDHPAWHPGGQWVAVEHSDSIDIDTNGIADHLFAGIWLVNAETGEKQPLLDAFALPAWNPDGSRMAMVRNSHIYTVAIQSLEPALVDSNSLTQLTTEGANFYPAWSNDGMWLAYDSNLNDPDGSHAIWKMRSDGTNKGDISEHGVGEWRNAKLVPKWVVHSSPEICWSWSTRSCGNGFIWPKSFEIDL